MDEAGRAGQRRGLHGAASVAMLVLACGLSSGCELGGVVDPAESPSATHTPTPLLWPEGTGEVRVPVGGTAQVALPEGSLGVGDDWAVLSVEPSGAAEAVVVRGSDVIGATPREPTDAVGGKTPFAVQITGTAAGEATVRVVYCTRTQDFSEDCDQSQGTLDAPVAPVVVRVQVG